MTRMKNLAISYRSGTESGVFVAALLFIGMYLVLSLISPAARSAYFLNNFAVLTTTLGIAAAGATVILITGGFDLSVAGVISIGNVLAATQMSQHPERVWIIAALIVVIGLMVGLVNGVFIAVLGLQSLAVTLGSYIILTGLALVILPAPGGSVPESFTATLTGTVGPVPVAVLVLLAVAVFWMAFVRTRTGIAAFAIGADAQAARMSGLRVRGVEVTCYGLAGMLYAMAGLYLSAVTASGDPQAGRPFLLTVFAAMALGLVSFRGGRGSAIAAIFGAATLTVIPKLLFAASVGDFWVGAFQGAIILAALSLPVFGRRVSQRFAPERRPLEEAAMYPSPSKVS